MISVAADDGERESCEWSCVAVHMPQKVMMNSPDNTPEHSASVYSHLSVVQFHHPIVSHAFSPHFLVTGEMAKNAIIACISSQIPPSQLKVPISHQKNTYNNSLSSSMHHSD